MTFKILTQDTNKVIHRSNVRSAETTDRPNLRRPHDPTKGEEDRSTSDPVLADLAAQDEV